MWVYKILFEMCVCVCVCVCVCAMCVRVRVVSSRNNLSVWWRMPASKRAKVSSTKSEGPVIFNR
jgi:hypothetical protein